MSQLKYRISFLDPVSEGSHVSMKSTSTPSGFVWALTACFFILLCWLITHLVCIPDVRSVWEFYQSGGYRPLVHLTLASLHPSIHPALHSTSAYHHRYVPGTGLGAENSVVSQPGHSPDLWIWQTGAPASTFLHICWISGCKPISPKTLAVKA